ncbi:membrane associated ubiquitin-protein ligase E3, MARCH family [Schizosaccharomyces osmophilus]|uniref:Membrane associated ubiquitin-protein ligase E3, MARCH family n=1 Tax=Schizosaccharomyces osmophilus TaxID=2545709 RepID=A0AAF0AW80_9SCHI|nr:membrane associated ubiquitin-protein ligase E3, MARCH family [Schizosaccharomyces osmophilus]WBW74386.1 membrane associated ubiquitin-protein ligase E3, MARCH family [Schizosaccharomyces osmophilus]
MESSCVDKTHPLRCWICYDEFDGVRSAKSPWRRPCKCSLIAHENCLVTYVTSSSNTRCPQCLSEYRIARFMKSKSWFLHAVGLCQNIESGLAQVALGTGLCLGITKSVYGIFRETGLWACRQVADEKSMLFVMQRPLFSLAILPILPCMLVRFCEAPSYDIGISLFIHCSVYICVDRFSTTQILFCALPWIRSIHKELTSYLKQKILVYPQEDDEESKKDWLRKLDHQIENQSLVTDEDAEVKDSELRTFFSVAHMFLDVITNELLRVLRPIILFPLAGRFLGQLFPKTLSKVQKSILGSIFALFVKDICKYTYLSWRAKKSREIRILDNQMEDKHGK